MDQMIVDIDENIRKRILDIIEKVTDNG